MSRNKKALRSHLESLKRCAVDLHVNQQTYMETMMQARRCEQQDDESARRLVERADASWQLVRTIESNITNLTALIVEICHE